MIFILDILAGVSDSGDAGASADWGDGYYWNSSSHQVEKTPW